METELLIKLLMGDTLKEPTPEILAELFWNMPDDEMARFFNHLGEVSGWRLVMQLQYVTDHPDLSLKGRSAMMYIGDYSHWGVTPQADVSKWMVSRRQGKA